MAEQQPKPEPGKHPDTRSENPDTRSENPDTRSENPDTRSENMKLIIRAERLTQIAFVLPAAVLIGWGIGALLDKWLHQNWIYIVGLVVGAAAGLTEAVRQALKEN